MHELRERQRERGRSWLLAQQGAGHRAWSQDPSGSQTLKWLSYPGAPHVCLFITFDTTRYFHFFVLFSIFCLYDKTLSLRGQGFVWVSTGSLEIKKKKMLTCRSSIYVCGSNQWSSGRMYRMIKIPHYIPTETKGKTFLFE